MEVQVKIKKIFAVVLTVIFILSGCSAKEKQTFEKGKDLLDRGQYVEAVETFDKAISIHGSKNIRGLEIDILRYRAEAEYRAGDYKAAEHTYKLLISADEERKEYLDMLAIIYTDLCNTDMDIEIKDAIEMYDKAGQLDDRSDLHVDAGLTVVEHYEEMYDKNMDSSYLDLAEDFLEKLLKESNRKNPKILMMYAEHMSKREDYTKALETVEEGMALLEGKNLKENDDEVLKSLMFSKGACYEYMSDYNKALEAFNAYIEKYGESDEVNHEVAFLKSRLR